MESFFIYLNFTNVFVSFDGVVVLILTKLTFFFPCLSTG